MRALCFSFIAILAGASIACGSSHDPRVVGDAGPAIVFDAGGGDTDAGPGGDTDAGPGTGMDAGPDGTDAGPFTFDAGGPFDAGPPAPRCATGTTHTYVLNVVDIGMSPPGMPSIVPGFDLDGRTSDTSDAVGCFKQDFTSPAPDSLMGVDNQMGPVLSSLGSSLDVSGSLAMGISSGQLLILVRVSGVDDFTTDDCIDIEVLFGLLPVGVTMPTLGTGGLLAPGQTFDIDANSVAMDRMTPLVRFPRGRIVAGRAQGTSITPFPIDLGGTGVPLVLSLQRPETRFDITPSAVNVGVLGGALDVNAVVMAVAGVGGLPITLVRTILEGQADLAPDAGGQCRSISIGLVYDGVTGVEGVVR